MYVRTYTCSSASSHFASSPGHKALGQVCYLWRPWVVFGCQLQEDTWCSFAVLLLPQGRTRRQDWPPSSLPFCVSRSIMHTCWDANFSCEGVQMDGWCRVWLWCAQYNLHAVDLRMFLHLLTYSASPVGHFTLCSRNLHEALHSRLAYFCVCSLLAILSTVPTPSPSVFPSPIQPSRTAAAAKDVKVFCAENSHFLKMWMAGIRMAKVWHISRTA